MKLDILKKWIIALRSGKYGQTTKRLRDNASYCCLGVLCDVIYPLGWDGTMFIYEDKVSMDELPYSLREYVGIPQKVEHELMKMNDIEQKDFNEIADWLEKRYFSEEQNKCL